MADHKEGLERQTRKNEKTGTPFSGLKLQINEAPTTPTRSTEVTCIHIHSLSGGVCKTCTYMKNTKTKREPRVTNHDLQLEGGNNIK